MSKKGKNEIEDLSKRVEALEKQAEELSKRKNEIKELSKRVDDLEKQAEELSKRIENFEKQMREDKEEEIKKLKAERDYAKFRCALPNIMEMMSHN